MNLFKNVTLEMSFKPFYKKEQGFVEETLRKMFRQWDKLLLTADGISVLLWTSDGSEILDYLGDMEETFEWSRFIGGANPRMKWDKKNDPERINLHATYYLYREVTEEFTYGDYKRIIKTIKKIGEEVTGKSVRVGATFDPGPEFAKSDFKYNRHNEICIGESMGQSSMVCCYGVLKGDNRPYAAFPEGIPEGTPFGTFFGRQADRFLKDMGFDYLWLSNGFGFGTETWGMTGAAFDGKNFYPERLKDLQDNILGFWHLFRKECDIRVETRGTNLSLGIDLASDGVNLKNIYEGNFDILPPCNSPWASINGDFGIEIAGYLSRMAELPEEDYICRYYVHDPWWMNSPWLDRYERQPHDIYLPLSAARVNKEGKVVLPSWFNILTVDNSLGEMPDICPEEILPHVMEAMRTAPDELSPFLWVYPFREYNEVKAGRLTKPFFEDMFIKGGINQGLPLNTVISSDNFVLNYGQEADKFKGSVLLVPVPVMEKELLDTLLLFVKTGGNVLLYGSLEGAEELVDLLGLVKVDPISGEMETVLALEGDSCSSGQLPAKVKHDSILSDGCVDTVLKSGKEGKSESFFFLRQGDKVRTAGVIRQEKEWKGGSLLWLRGTLSGEFREGESYFSEYGPTEVFSSESLLRIALQKFGYRIGYRKKSVCSKSPVVMVSRHDNAFYFNGYCPDTTVELKLEFPLGAPLLLGEETYLENGCSVYHMPRAWHKECRVFIKKEKDGRPEKESRIISFREIPSVSFYLQRRFEVKGIKNATLTIFPSRDKIDGTEILLNPKGPLVTGEDCDIRLIETKWGKAFQVKGVTGTVVISERRELTGKEKKLWGETL